MKRFAYLDVLRALSVTLVMFGHYVSVGSFAKEIPGIAAKSTPLPIVQSEDWGLWHFDIWLINWPNTQAGVLGVTLFFMITGYLMPVMLERYSRRVFVINRFFRIFPVLLAGCVVISLLVSTTQGIDISLQSFAASITLTYLFAGVAPVVGVLWTLVSEVIFYGISACVGRFTVQRLLFVEAVLFAITAAAAKTNGGLAITALHQTKALFIICAGSAIYLAEKEDRLALKLALIGSGLAFAYAGLQYVQLTGKIGPTSYENLGNLLTAAGLFLAFHHASFRGGLARIPAWLSHYADLVYPLYIIHVPFGLLVMIGVRSFTSNPYIMLAAAVATAIGLAVFLRRYVEAPGIAIGRRVAVIGDAFATGLKKATV